MICSAVVSYSLVRKNDDEIANLQSEIKISRKQLITYGKALNHEAKIDNAILISLLSKNHKKIIQK